MLKYVLLGPVIDTKLNFRSFFPSPTSLKKRHKIISCIKQPIIDYIPVIYQHQKRGKGGGGFMVFNATFRKEQKILNLE